MNRIDDLRKIMLDLIEGANESPPIEITILDYNSQDGLEDYIKGVKLHAPLRAGSSLNYVRYTGRSTYHMAHARNLSVLQSHGEYFVIWSTDLIPYYRFFSAVREYIEKEKPVWMHPIGETEIIICRRDEFIAAGGYDERMEFYGPEGKDLNARLTRRGGKMVVLPSRPFIKIPTTDEVKVENYSVHSKGQMFKRMKAIFEENCATNALVANQGRDWGQM